MSATSLTLRAVTTAFQPLARTSLAISRPKPVEQPVMNQVVMVRNPAMREKLAR